MATEKGRSTAITIAYNIDRQPGHNVLQPSIRLLETVRTLLAGNEATLYSSNYSISNIRFQLYIMVKTTVLAEFPPGFFLEQISATRAGGVFVSVANREELYYIQVTDGHNAPVLLHKYDRHQWAMGIVEAPHDPNIHFVLSSDLLSQGANPSSHLYVVNMANPMAACTPQHILKFPAEAKGLNGMCALSESVLLVADSFASCK